jgi:glutathione S-transferase
VAKNLPAVPDAQEKFQESLEALEGFLKPTGFAAGTKNFTLADLAFLASISTADATGFFDLSK